MRHKPPLCPECGNPLYYVSETVYETYDFDENSGVYKESSAVMEITCPICGADLYEIFPHGCCNYRR